MLKSVHIRIPQETYNMFKSILDGETMTNAIIRLMKQETYFYHNRKKDVVRIVNGRQYNTETAQFISETELSGTHIFLHLYKKESGELFICTIKNGYMTNLPDIITQDHELFSEYFAKMPVTEDVYNMYEE